MTQFFDRKTEIKVKIGVMDCDIMQDRFQKLYAYLDVLVADGNIQPKTYDVLYEQISHIHQTWNEKVSHPAFAKMDPE